MGMAEVIYQSEDKSVTLHHDVEHSYFTQVGVGDVPDNFYKKIHNVYLTKLRETKCKNVIYDLTNQTKTDLISRAWFAALYTPKVFKEVGSDFVVAIVNSKNKFENFSIEMLVKTAKGLGMNGTIEFFDDRDKAHEWMRENVKKS